MFGRVRRAAQRIAGAQLQAYGVVHTYDPMVLGGAAAAAMGAAAAGSGAAIARNAQGEMVSATSRAVDSVLSWANRGRARFISLPGTILLVLTGDRAAVHAWTLMGCGTELAVWRAGTFEAEQSNSFSEHEVRLTFSDRRNAVLSVRTGPQHRHGRRALAALARLGSVPTIR